MKKVIRLTESELKNLVMNSVLKVLKEDVLGDHFTQVEGYDNTDVDNNYEVFDNDEDHDFSTQGDTSFDPTYYEQ